MKFVNVTQLSALISVKTQTIYDWVHKERIPYHKLGRLVRFDLDDIERWLKTKRHRRVYRN